MTPLVARVEFDIRDDALIDSLWKVYCEHFVDVPPGCIEYEDCYPEPVFRRIMVDVDYVKFITVDDANHAQGYLLATANMEKMRQDYLFVNPERLRVLYPAEYAEGRLLYIPSLATSVKGGSDLMVEIMTEYAVARSMILVFDYSTEKHPSFPNYALHQVKRSIKKRALAVTDAEFQIIGGQHYGAIVLKK